MAARWSCRAGSAPARGRRWSSRRTGWLPSPPNWSRPPRRVCVTLLSAAGAAGERDVADDAFRLEEATIEDVHKAIQAGRTSCAAIVREYLARARAYNGVAS